MGYLLALVGVVLMFGILLFVVFGRGGRTGARPSGGKEETSAAEPQDEGTPGPLAGRK